MAPLVIFVVEGDTTSYRTRREERLMTAALAVLLALFAHEGAVN